MPASAQLALTIAYDKVRRGGWRPWKGYFSDCWEATGATGNVKPQILAPHQVMHDGTGAGPRPRQDAGVAEDTSRSVAAYAYAMPQSGNLAKCSVSRHLGCGSEHGVSWVHGPINSVSL